jgi:hypothetical protein
MQLLTGRQRPAGLVVVVGFSVGSRGGGALDGVVGALIIILRGSAGGGPPGGTLRDSLALVRQRQ